MQKGIDKRVMLWYNVLQKERKTKMKMNIDYEWIAKAIETIKSGFVKRLDNSDKTIAVYQCGSIIRVDIKN